MRRISLLVAVLALVGCGGGKSGDTTTSRIFGSTAQSGEAPAGQQAGGPATLVEKPGGKVVGKGLLVLRSRGADLVVRNPHGGTLTLTHRHPPNAKATIAPGDHVSFVGIRSGTTVQVSTLAAT